MRYEQIKEFKDSQFKRLTGVKRETFTHMVEVVRVAYKLKHQNRGRASSLSIEDMILLMLSYLRSYATYFETGVTFGVSESSAQRISVWVEDVLISSGLFSLPGKKVLTEEDSGIEIVLVDVTEQEIERPKKNKKTTTQERKSDTL